jgi:hypothetical protein
MRGFGDFQRMQMRRTDPRVNELFDYLRKAIDLLEQMMLRPVPSQEANLPGQIRSEDRLSPVASEPAIPRKLAYRIKELSELVGVSRTALYRAMVPKPASRSLDA